MRSTGRRPPSARLSARPCAPHDQRTQRAYLFGAICPKLATGAALVMPFAATAAVQAHLEAISAAIDDGAQAVLILDRPAGTCPGTAPCPATSPSCPCRPARPNSTMSVWQFLRQNGRSNRVFGNHDGILAHFCAAWNKLTNQLWQIMSIGTGDRANGF